MTPLKTRTTASAWRSEGILALVALVVAFSVFVLPVATLSRSFNGEGLLVLHPGRLVNFTGFVSKIMPDFVVFQALVWLQMLALLLLAWVAWARPRWLGWSGMVVCALVVVGLAAFVRAVDVVQLPLLEAGTPYRRLPFRNFGPSLWMYLAFFVGLTAILFALARHPKYSAGVLRLRGGVVPAVAIGLSMLVGAVVILVLQPVPGIAKTPQDAFGAFVGKADLLWYSYSMLFGPLVPKFRPALDLAGLWQSLSLATPLVFTGLSLSFAFRAGLFNIGAPGQVIVGAIFCTAVGVYLPAPAVLAAPLAVLAAALGGALWGAIPGFLKARFGSSEVINTIMLNYIASGLLVFLIGASEARFFGNVIKLPFRAEGGEAKSLELLPGSHLRTINELFGITTGLNQISLAPILAFLAVLVAALWLRARQRGPRDMLLGALGAGALGLLLGLVLPRVPMQISNAFASAKLNLSFLIALGAAVFYGVFMWRTKWGFELRAVGLAPKAAEYGGINIARNTILAMAIAGALAGLAATHYVLGGAMDEYRLKQAIPADAAGFGGITISLLGQNTPLGVIAAAVLFGVLGTGGLNLDQSLEYVSRDIVTVLQALIVLFITTRGFLSGDFLRSLNAPPKTEEPPDPPKAAEPPNERKDA